jgi:hypothetical protein
MDYVASIELDRTSRELNHAKLNAELAKSQFYFIAMGADGVTGFMLPTGTYYCYATYPDIDAAHAAVRSAMSRSSLTGKLFITAVSKWQSSNLEIVPAEPLP